MQNLYKPILAKIEKKINETDDIITLRLKFVDQEIRDKFSFKAGQFAEYSIFGEGECTFCISSSPVIKDYIECTFKKIGKVTSSLYNAEEGDIIGFRGPYGNYFNLDEIKGKDIIFIAGGIGFAPIRSVMNTVLHFYKDFGELTLVYGARSVADLVYKRKLDDLSRNSKINLIKTVDPGGETDDWDGKIGFVPTIVEQENINSNGYAIICGPPIMIKFTIPVLLKKGFFPERILTTLENRMKCGIGKCGRCNIGSQYVCKDGPVFNYEQLKKLPDDF